MSESDGKIVRRTKTLLQQSVIELLKEKDLEQITVKDIISYADFNRSTFYRHYMDKYDLVDKIKLELLEDLVATIKKVNENNHLEHPGETKKVSYSDVVIFNYVYEKKEYFIVWKYLKDNTNAQKNFFDVLHYIFKNVVVITPKNSSSLSEEEIINFLCHGLFGILLDWIENDFEKSPDLLTRKLLELLQFFNVQIKIDVNPVKATELKKKVKIM